MKLAAWHLIAAPQSETARRIRWRNGSLFLFCRQSYPASHRFGLRTLHTAYVFTHLGEARKRNPAEAGFIWWWAEKT